MVFHVAADHELGESLVLQGIDSIAHHAQHVETGQNRLGQVDVLCEGTGGIVSGREMMKTLKNLSCF